ncbi:MAG: mechanosensitive ion channel family protein [Candidatus Heimdallarchaeota archaeon]
MDIIELLEQYWLDYQRIIIAGVLIIVILIIQRILVRAAKRSVTKAHLPPEAANGIVLIIRLAAVFAIFATLTSYAGLTSEALALSTFIGAAVGFASAQTIGNIIAGIYVMITRPFRIGDYIKIGAEEGIVREISLNYTRIQASDGTRVLVPNRNVINQTLRRYRRVLRTEKEHEEEQEETAFNKALAFLRDQISEEKEIYVYPFDVAIHASYSMKTATKVFDKVCEQWTEKFGYPPTYFISELPSYQTKYKFFITVDDPVKIYQLKPEFLRDILARLEETKTQT